MRFIRLIPSIFMAALFAGCAGSHGSSTLPSRPAQTAKGTGIATFVIKIPASTGTTTTARVSSRSAKSIRPQYVSPATQSIKINISGPTDVNETANLTVNSAGCVSSLASTICTLTVPGLLPGNYTATLTTYDQTGGTGNVLSAAQSIGFTITAGQTNQISLTLSGVPASTLVVPDDANVTANGTGGYNLVGQGARKFIAESLDADRNIIVGSGAPLFTIGTPSGSLAGVTTAPSTTTPSAPNSFSVTPPVTYASGTASFPVAPTFTGQATDGCAQAGANCSGVTVTVDMKYIQSLLFVANFGSSTVTVYPSSDYTTASPTVISAGVNQPIALALDASGDLFVSNQGGSPKSVTEYPSSNYTTASPTVIQPGGTTRALALDSSGNLFVAGANNVSWAVTEYAKGNYTGAPIASITTDIVEPRAVALDSSGDVFVLNFGNVTEYPAGNYTTASPTVMSTDLYCPAAMALDSSGDVFVANECTNPSGAWTVVEYPHSNYTTASPTVISTDLVSPIALVVDSSGDLFVTNCAAGYCGAGSGLGTVTEYPASNYLTASPTVISADMAAPNALALDSSSDLFVATCASCLGIGHDTVELYPASNYTTASPTIINSPQMQRPGPLAVYTQP